MNELTRQIQKLDDAMQAFNANITKAEQLRNERVFLYNVATANTRTYLANPLAYFTAKDARKIIRDKTVNKGIVFLYIVLAVVYVFLAPNLLKKAEENINNLYILLALFIALMTFAIVTNVSRKKRLKKYIEELARVSPEETELIEKAQAIAYDNAEVAAILPDEYRYPMVTSYIRRLFETNRVSTINEALTMADEQIHRWKVEESQRAILAEQQRQAQMITSLQWQQAWADLALFLK